MRITDRDRLRAVAIVWACIAITFIAYGCAERPVLGDPDHLTRSWLSQGWPGTESLRIVERPLIDVEADCHGDPVGCAQYDPATETCTIWLAPTAGKSDLEHEELHCLDAHLRTEETAHRYAAERQHVQAIAFRSGPIGDTRDWWALDPARANKFMNSENQQ